MSLSESVALRVESVPQVDAASGRNAICTVHVPPGGVPAELHELLATSKSLLLVPFKLTPVNTSDPAFDPVALLVMVMGCADPAVCTS